MKKKNYPVIEVPASGKPKWSKGAFTLCFVYSKYKGNFILKGFLGEVEEYLKKNYTHYFYNMTLWSDGRHRNIWGFWKKNVGIFEPSNSRILGMNKKYRIREYYDSYSSDEEERKKEAEELSFKRMPNRWIPPLDNF